MSRAQLIALLVLLLCAVALCDRRPHKERKHRKGEGYVKYKDNYYNAEKHDDKACAKHHKKWHKDEEYREQYKGDNFEDLNAKGEEKVEEGRKYHKGWKKDKYRHHKYQEAEEDNQDFRHQENTEELEKKHKEKGFRKHHKGGRKDKYRNKDWKKDKYDQDLKEWDVEKDGEGYREYHKGWRKDKDRHDNEGHHRYREGHYRHPKGHRKHRKDRHNDEDHRKHRKCDKDKGHHKEGEGNSDDSSSSNSTNSYDNRTVRNLITVTIFLGASGMAVCLLAFAITFCCVKISRHATRRTRVVRAHQSYPEGHPESGFAPQFVYVPLETFNQTLGGQVPMYSPYAQPYMAPYPGHYVPE